MPIWLDIVVRVGTALAASVGAVVAVLGLRAWKAQLRGKTEYDLARRVLRAVLEVREAITNVRNPLVSRGEITEAFRVAGVDPSTVDYSHDDPTNGLVYERRWQPLSKALTNLSAEVLEAEVLWGPDVRAPEHELRSRVHELNAAIFAHFDRSRSRQHDRDVAAAQERMDRDFKVVYNLSSADREDDFAASVSKAVQAMAELLRPHLHLRA